MVDPDAFPQSVASGDPRPESVVLWTRCPASSNEDDVRLRLELSLDPEFDERISFDDEPFLSVRAEARWDHCVRVRVDGLTPDTRYYYRFLRRDDDRWRSSRTGRTMTAPAPSSDREVRFAVMSCQDYGGRYYHVHRHAAEQDLDFFVHLGDYIYETAGDPRFQEDDAARRVRFTQPEEALELRPDDAGQTEGASFLAARSIGNYRDLYRLVRSDRNLQRLHERAPMICVWDDHEFANDGYGQTATDSGGHSEEPDPERRANADQAWFEYMPVDYRAGDDFQFERDEAFPNNLRIERDFHFGRHVHLVMTDLRRFRANHLIDESAPPAAVAVTQERLLELFGALPEQAQPYLDIDDMPEVRARLVEAAEDGVELGVDPARLSGNVNGPLLNQLITRYNDAYPEQLLDPLELDDSELPRGIAYVQVGKTSDYSSFGSRLFVEPEVFRLIAADRFDATSGASEAVMGEDQREWFVSALRESSATWKLWGNSYTLATRRIDLSSLSLPDGLNRRFQLSADDWDGVPNEREQLLDALGGVENLVALTGDSHSFFAGGLGVEGGEHVLEFVCGAVSSSTYQAVLGGGAADIPGIEVLAPLAGPLILSANPHFVYQNVSDNGYAVVRANADELVVTFQQIPHPLLARAELDGSLSENFTSRAFRVRSGSARVEQF